MSRINDLKQQNPQLDVSLIDIIASLDPTSTYKYLGFMLKLIKREIGDKDPKKIMGELLFDEEHVDYLKRFESHCIANRMKNPDISSYNSLEEVSAAITTADQILKLKEAEKQVIKLFESKEYVVVIPLTFEASKNYGSNTKWCVTQESYWQQYQWKWKLIYIIDKVNNKKYAVSRKYDDNTKVQGWLADDSEISPILIPLPHEVSSVVFPELAKPKFETEISVLKEENIITNEGVIIPFDRVDRNQIKKFIEQFGSHIPKTFMEKLKTRTNQLGVGNVNKESKMTLEKKIEPQVVMNDDRTTRMREIMDGVDNQRDTTLDDAMDRVLRNTGTFGGGLSDR